MKRKLMTFSYGLMLWLLGGVFLFFIGMMDLDAKELEKVDFTLGVKKDRKKLVDTVRTGFTDDPALETPSLGTQSEQERAEEVELHLNETAIQLESMQDELLEIQISNSVISPQVP